MIKMYIDNEEVVCNNLVEIKEEMHRNRSELDKEIKEKKSEKEQNEKKHNQFC